MQSSRITNVLTFRPGGDRVKSLPSLKEQMLARCNCWYFNGPTGCDVCKSNESLLSDCEPFQAPESDLA